MPTGNYTENIRNRNKITLADIEQFIFGLLVDVCENSTNEVLGVTQVNFEGDLNVSDLNSDGIECLVSFKMNSEDPRNKNLGVSLKDGDDNLHAVYEIGLVMRKGFGGDDDTSNSIRILQAWQAIVDGLTNNWNGTAAKATLYQAPVPSGNTLSSPLTSNESDLFPNVEILGESVDQPNYLTVTSQIVFTINKVNN